MRNRAWLWIVAVVLSLGSTVGYWFWMGSVDVEQTTIKTLMPTRLLKSGEVIDTSMIRQLTISEGQHRKDAILDLKAILGKTVVVPVGADEEFAAWKLASISLVPKENERYVTFKADAEMNVNNMVRKGDQVDVWVTLDQPKPVITVTGTVFVGAVKLMESLTVASVKSGDGVEVTDDMSTDLLLNWNNNGKQLLNERGKANGVVDKNTYIMTDELMDAYVKGMAIGKIKLALPNLTDRTLKQATTTETFRQLESSGFFLKGDNLPTVTTKASIKPTEVIQQQVEAPKATEVNP